MFMRFSHRWETPRNLDAFRRQTMALADKPDPSEPGGIFTMTVSVTGTTGTPPGVESVTVSDDPGSCVAAILDGMGSCSLALSTPSTFTLTAVYGSDAPYAPSSATEAHIVLEVSVPSL